MKLATTSRIHAVDALRGFALAGIVLVHMVENYIAGPVPEGAMVADGIPVLDGITQTIIELFLRGKFFAIFSFLFGLSFFIQMNNAQERGKDLSGRFFWRLILLLAIGWMHHLFYRGDILTIYAIIGMLLIPLNRINSRWLAAIAVVLMIGLGRYFIFSIFGANSLLISFEMGPNSPEVITYFETLKTGSLWEVWQTNATQGHLMKADFQLGIFGRAYLTLSFFILGLLAGRIGFFNSFQKERKLWRKRLYWCIGLFVLSGAAIGGFFALGSSGADEGGTFGLSNWWHMLGLSAMDLANFWMFAIIIIGFMLLFGQPKNEKRLMIFAPYGRMALTNYLGQTLIGTFLLMGWGLGFIGEWPASVAFGVGLLIIFVQMLASNWWLKRFNYGPLEWLWRSLTYFKWYQFRK